MAYNFDQFIDRSQSESLKWRLYGDDVLPLWVADMDFQSPEPVIRALRRRVEHGVFGYGLIMPELCEIVVERLYSLYRWRVSPEALVFLPGVVPGFNLACRAVTSPGDGVLVQTPVYPPILRAPANAGLSCDEMELTRRADGYYEIDFDLFEDTITERTRVFILCNPHNPVGRVFRREELERMAEICLRHDVVICSDEIHCDLVFEGHQHIPIASLAPEIGERTITLMAPSKTYNIAGLKCSVAIIENAELREKFNAARAGLVGGVNVLGYTAALAAYRDGQPWLEEVLRYLEANRDFLLQYVHERLPGITMVSPEGTYLGWLDCRQAGIPGNPHEFFLREAKVALNDGATFGRGGEGFVRLNFGCPRSTLLEALNRMEKALRILNEKSLTAL
ncbi:MAG: putative C-S lyase [Anaerolineae bacterium]|nr:putative C-S lyase [Anaerolineae bacterium]